MILSEFQIKAIDAIHQGYHVLITAHTGSGKTLPAEKAIEYFTSQGKSVIYTAPIKALSNQKFHEFTKKFSDLQVGIFTGDNKHNPSADVLIMTTEILQNKLLHPTATHLDFSMDKVGCVIFDEVHYLDDEDRGTVWEKSIILLPQHIQMVMLSATIGKKEQFASWIERIKERKVVICSTDKRVVPLVYYQFFTANPKVIDNTKDPALKKLLESKQNKLTEITDDSMDKNKKCLKLLKEPTHRKQVLNQLCIQLREKEMFPCLCFVFSRKQVEELAREITTPLFDPGEKDYEIEPICRQLLVSRLKNWKEYIALPEYRFYLDLLHKGIGIHHAGMLPVFREMMEILYDQKYIQLLFATETFAIGLNMPTKTVCFTSVYKHDGHSLRTLYPHEFIQMSGRAGRRNLDTIGHVILLSNLYEPLESVYMKQLLHSPPKVLKSKFKIGYSLLLQSGDCEFVKKSLMMEDIDYQIQNSAKKIEKLQEECDGIFYDFSRIQSYVEWREKLPLSKNKTKHELTKKMKEAECLELFDHLEKFDRRLSLAKEIEAETERKAYAEGYIDRQLASIDHVLEINGFKTNPKQEIASMLHEVHPLVFTDLLVQYDFFKDYSTIDLFTMISCFCEMKVQDSYLKLSPDYLKDECLFVKTRMNNYLQEEWNHELSASGQEMIQYDLMEFIQKWMNCENELDSLSVLQEVKMKKGIFIGDFIKACLKMVNIAKELDRIERLDFREKLREGTTSLMKFICTHDSLYL
jgi:superfamily II RNA helicase